MFLKKAIYAYFCKIGKSVMAFTTMKLISG